MSDFLTRKGATQVTSDIDRIASLIQEQHVALGIPERVAKDFCYRCDLVSDAVERRAMTNEKASNESARVAAAVSKGDTVTFKIDGTNYTGKVDKVYGAEEADVSGIKPRHEGDSEATLPMRILKKKEANFPAEDIGEKKSGPLEKQPDESYMAGEFTQQENSELREKQQGGNLASPDKMATIKALMASVSELQAQIQGLVAEDEEAEAEEADAEGSKQAEDEEDEVEEESDEAASKRARLTQPSPKTTHGYNLFS